MQVYSLGTLASASVNLGELCRLLSTTDLLAALPPAPEAATAPGEAMVFQGNNNPVFTRGQRGQLASREYNMRQQVTIAQNSITVNDNQWYNGLVRLAGIRDGRS